MNNKAGAVRRAWRRFLPFGRVAFFSYVGVIVVLLAFENALVYRPTTAAENWQAAPARDVQDVTFTAADGRRIHAWWWPVAGSRDAVLYCHGNAGNLSHRGSIMSSIRATLNASVLIFDYPGYGRSEGRPSEAGCYAAARAAHDWLVADAGVDPERIIIYGDSLGGGVAVDLAQQRPHRALALVKTFTSAPDVAQEIYPWLPVRWLMRNRFNSLEKIGKCDRPVFIAHGTSDEVVPFQQGQRLFAAANSPKLFVSMPDLGHNEPMPVEMFVKLKEFLNEARPSRVGP